MHYLKYFKDKFGFPQPGVVGKESDWLDLGEISVPHGDLWIGDAGVPNRSEGCTLKVPPGQYLIQIKGMDFKGTRVPSRARAFLKGAAKLALGARRGRAITDQAQAGICDISALEAIVTKKHLKEFEEDLQKQMTETQISTQTFEYGKRRFDMAFVASGFSDGSYAVFALKADGKVAGLEVEFLPARFKMIDIGPRQVFKGVRGKKERQQLEKLLEACKEGELAAVRSILRTDPKLSTASGPIGFLEEVTPLHVTACFGHANIAEFLLSKGVPVEALDDTGNTPVMQAAQYGYADIVRLLLKHKAPVNVVNRFGETALHYAVYPDAGRAEVVGLLLEAGANPTVRNNTDKTTPLERAQEYLRRDPEADEIKKIINLLTATK